MNSKQMILLSEIEHFSMEWIHKKLWKETRYLQAAEYI